jgi:putative endonuclease
LCPGQWPFRWSSVYFVLPPTATDKRKSAIGTKLKKKYKIMLAGMQKKEKTGSPASQEQWYLYILECSDGTLYTGITKDLGRRFAQHTAGTASRYTRVRRPVHYVYHEPCSTHTAALVRECEVKEMTREQKKRLYQIPNPKKQKQTQTHS